MGILCDFIFVGNITIDTSNHSNICVCNFTKIIYSAPVTSYQLLHSSQTLSQDLLPTPIRVKLTLVKKLLQHEDLCQWLERVRKNGHKTLITVHHDAELMHHVLERVKKDVEHHCWETLLEWAPTAMGVFNFILHTVVILLTLTLMCLLPVIILYIKFWYMIKQITQLQSPKTYKLTQNKQYFTTYLPWIYKHTNYQYIIYGTEARGDHTTTL